VYPFIHHGHWIAATFLAVVNNATMNNGYTDSKVSTFNYFGYILRRRVTGLNSNSIFAVRQCNPDKTKKQKKMPSYFSTAAMSLYVHHILYKN
jgi:hypothetical protein